MLDRPVSRDRYPQRVADVRALIAAGDDDGLAAALVDLAADNGDHWAYDGADVRDAVAALPETRRHAVLLRIVDAAAEAGVQAGSLVTQTATGISAGVLSWRAARAVLDVVAGSVVSRPGLLRAVAEVAERETGDIPPPLLAVIRRTVQRWPTITAEIRPWADKAAPGTLNAGEAWAEAAVAQSPDPQLLEHALAASGARPAAGWTRRAAALTADLGGQACRAMVRDWFALVPQPRTIRLRRYGLDDPNEIPDPYNARALRGLLYLLAVTPPHEDDPAAVGRLAQYMAEKVPGHGPRSQAIAHAAVFALERFSTVPALRELARLRSAGQPKGIAGALTAAIARRSVALGVDAAAI